MKQRCSNLYKIFILLFFISASFTVKAADIIKILAIGNSFSEDAIENYLYDIAKADNVTLIIGNMYIPGCSLETHWNNASNNVSAYSYRKIDITGTKVTTENVTLETAIQDENWDYISLQQVSQNSGIASTYFPYLTDLLDYVKSKATNPQVKYVLHSTWAYAKNSDHSGFTNYNNNQNEMYSAIVQATTEVAQQVGIDIIIPSGTAVQNGRSSFIGDNYCRDGYHLDYGVGRYTVACAWYEKITGNPVVGNSFEPNIAQSRINIAQKAAHYAVSTPSSVTDMSAENPFPAADTYLLKNPINIDFGHSTKLSTSPWNNITSTAEGTYILGLLDSQGNETPVKIEINDAFGNINQNGPADGLIFPEWALPKEATSDSFWGNAGTAFEGKNEVTGGFLISNLNPNKKYDFMFLSSRSATDNREASFKVTGANEKIGFVNGSSNTTELIKITEITPKADGTITIVLSAGPNNNNATKFFYINALQIAPSVESHQTLTQKLYFDFGAASNVTANPDVNGNYWNNPSDPKIATAVPIDLINSLNQNTGFVFNVTKNFTANGKGMGGLDTPSAELLGDFAIATATQDYFFVEGSGNTGEFKISNLDKTKGYRFYMFGSRTNDGIRIAKFTFTGLNTAYGFHQTTGAGTGVSGYNANNNVIFISDIIYPDTNADITVDVARHYGSYAHLNVMKIEEYEVDIQKATSLTVSGNDIIVSGATSQMTATVYPENAIHSPIIWSVDNENIAWIDEFGKLYPKANGTVTVTATINDENGDITDSKQITISNQVFELFFSGTATENGDNVSTALPLQMVTDLNGSVSSIFEIYTSLNGTGTFNFYSSQDAGTATIYGANGAEGFLSIGENPINSSVTGPVKITVNLGSNTYTITPIVDMSVVGSVTNNRWSLSDGLLLDYKGNGVWSNTLTFGAGTSSDPARFIFVMNRTNWNYSFKKITGTDNKISLSSQGDQYGYTVEDILSNMNGGTYIVTLNLNDYTYSVVCESVNDYKISVMGSSVANGQGATNMQGYAYMYGQLLQQRSNAGTGLNWQTSGISINGNSTINLLERWEKDLIGDCSGYVLYGLSLGNEGIHENGQSSFDRFETNMQLLIEKARQNNKVPVVTNSYTRGDFNLTDYDYVKQMNLLIHQWDVPSINFLGAIDNGAGKWADGYQVEGDIYHPTTEGHAEFFYAMVPSLFDALEAGKPSPTRQTGTFYSFAVKGHLEFTPEETIHPFTISVDIKTISDGIISSFTESEGKGILSIKDGKVVYESPITGKIEGGLSVRDNQWHKITLTHYYAQGITILYVDNVKEGNLNEKLLAGKFFINDGINAINTIDYRDLFFYRSAMNQEEISALNDGKMLKSSLELYAPLDNSLINLAQSTNNSLKFIPDGTVSINDAVNDSDYSVYPTIVNDILFVYGAKNEVSGYKIYSMQGSLIEKNTIRNNYIDVTAIKSGLYILEINPLSDINRKSLFKFLKN